MPIYKDHKVIGVLGGSCNVTALSHMLFNDLLTERETVFWLQVMERSLPLTVGSASGTEITYGIIFFKYYGEKNLKGKHALQGHFRKILKLAKEVW